MASRLLTVSLLSMAIACYATEDNIIESRLPESRLHMRFTIESMVGSSRKADPQTDSLMIKLEPEWELDFSDVRLVMGARIVKDSEDNLIPGETVSGFYANASRPYDIGDSAYAEFRNVYLEWSGYNCGLGIESCMVRLGKQQVVWGQADGIKLLDVVNPQSFDYFILDEYEDSRIPLWMANIDLGWGDNGLQILWIPDTSVHSLPKRGSRYQFRSPVLLPTPKPGSRPVFEDYARPSVTFDNSDWGMRFTSFYRGWDVGLEYLYKYSDQPVMRTHERSVAEELYLFITPEYRRQHIVGTTFSNALDALTFRGEVAYITPRYFVSANPADADSVVEGEEFAYVLGFDWYEFRDTLLSVQYYSSHFFSDEENNKAVRGRNDEMLTFLLKRTFVDGTYTFKYEHHHILDRDDGLRRVSASYRINDGLVFQLQWNQFYGEREGLYGQYRHNDHVAINLEYNY